MKSGEERPRNKINLDRREVLKGIGIGIGAGFVAGGVIGKLFYDTVSDGHKKDGLEPGSDKAWLNETLTEERKKEYMRNAFQIRLLESLQDKDLKDISEKKDSLGELESKINQRLDKASESTPEVHGALMQSKALVISWFSDFSRQNETFKTGNIEQATQALKNEINRRVEGLKEKQDSIFKRSPINPPGISQ